jgi:hypothetical protein
VKSRRAKTQACPARRPILLASAYLVRVAGTPVELGGECHNFYSKWQPQPRGGGRNALPASGPFRLPGGNARGFNLFNAQHAGHHTHCRAFRPPPRGSGFPGGSGSRGFRVSNAQAPRYALHTGRPPFVYTAIPAPPSPPPTHMRSALFLLATA